MAKRTNRKFRPYERKEAITPIEYGGLQQAYDHFNAALFGGTLPDVFITYQRRAHSAGYFSPHRFSSRTEKSGQHELALNPDGFIGHSDQQIVQTLVHEMTHAWQQAFGQPSGRGYHNREWSEKMKAIGLYPSSTGMVGGRETGQQMSNYVIPDGPFVRSYEKLAATGWRLNLQSAPQANPKRGPTKDKTTFRCEADCGHNVWGKPCAKPVCGFCLIRKLEAAGIDPAIIVGARMPADAQATAVVVLPPSSEPIPLELVKRKPGRPKGSKNKPKAVPLRQFNRRTKTTELGRPKGSKNKKRGG